MHTLSRFGALLLAVQVVIGSSYAQEASQTIEYHGTCLRHEDGKAIAGAMVRLYIKEYLESRIVVTTKSDEHGSFELRHVISRSRPACMVVTAPDCASQIVALNNATGKLVIRLPKAVVVNGRILDADGTAVPDAIVHVGHHSIAGVRDAVSDENGRFQLDDLPEMVMEIARDGLLKHRLFASHPQLGMKSIVIERIPCEADIQFDTVLPDDYGMQFRVAGNGTHKMPNGVTMTISSVPYHGPNLSTQAVLQWPAKDGLPAMQKTIQIASDSFGNRDHWITIWPKDRCQFWIANSMGEDPQIQAIDFSDPTSIVTLYRALKPNKVINRPGQDIHDARVRRLLGKDSNRDVPPEVLRLIRSRFPKVRADDDRHQIYGYTGTSEAITVKQWRVQGTVTDQHGKPLPSILVQATEAGSGDRVASAATKEDGTYDLKFELNLHDASLNPDIRIAPVLANHFDRTSDDAGCFQVTIQKLQPTDSLLLGQVAHADFEMWPAATLMGNLSGVHLQAVVGGRIHAAWVSPGNRKNSRSAPIDRLGRFRMPELPTGRQNKVIAELRDSKDRVLGSGQLVLLPGRMALSVDESWRLSAEPVSLGPVAVSIVRNQKSVAPPDQEVAFSEMVRDWIESCQANNTQAVKEHDPDVWKKVVGGRNVVHLQYRESQKMLVHTDEGAVPRMITEIAFPMYDMRPGALFARSDDETLVLESPLIEPTIRIISDRSMDCFVSKWYRPYIDAWNHAPPDTTAVTANIGVDVDGVLTLDGKPVPKDIHQLSGVLRTAGYDRRDSIAVITADPLTAYGKLHWVMWKLGQSGWKNRIVLRVGP